MKRKRCPIINSTLQRNIEKNIVKIYVSIVNDNKRIAKNTLALYKNARHDDEGSVYLQNSIGCKFYLFMYM